MALKNEKIKTPFKMYGNKKQLSKSIIEVLPSLNDIEEYVEPYCGTASVCLNKDKTKLEVINDIDSGIISIFRAIRDECSTLTKKLKKIEQSKSTFEKALEQNQFENNLDKAVNEFILRNMSVKCQKRVYTNSENWVATLEELPLISKRLKTCFIFNKPAIEVIKAFDNEKTLCFVDPPSLEDLKKNEDLDTYDMSTDDHIELAKNLVDFKGKVVLSGYQSTLYKRLYKEWNCIKKIVPNKIKSKQTECIWTNY